MSSRHDTPPSLEQRARRRLRRKTGLAIHALVYLLVNAGLFGLSLLGGWGDDSGFRHGRMMALPLWGWGLGLLIHATVVTVSLRGDGLRQRLLAREIETLKQRDSVR